jgi:hypothetical protein
MDIRGDGTKELALTLENAELTFTLVQGTLLGVEVCGLVQRGTPVALHVTETRRYCTCIFCLV